MPSSQAVPAAVVPVIIRNTRSVPLRFLLEPWGEEYRVEPQSEVRIEFHGPGGESPIIEWGEHAVTAYGWSGSTARVFVDQQEVGA
jgi:hypothetical protein